MEYEFTPSPEQAAMSLRDQQLAQEIETVIRKDASLGEVAYDIHVKAQEGIVILEGKVSTEQEKITAFDKATALAGLGKVKNAIQVNHA